MKLKLSISKVIKAFLASTLVLGLALTPSVANAKSHHSHYHHYRYSRVYRHHHHAQRHSYRRRTKHTKRTKRYARKSRHHYAHHHKAHARKHHESVYDELQHARKVYRNKTLAKLIRKNHLTKMTKGNTKRQIRNLIKESIKLVNRDRAEHNLQPVSEDFQLDELANQRAHEIVHNFNHTTTGKPATKNSQIFYYREAPKYGIAIKYLESGENIAEQGYYYKNYSETGYKAAKNINYGMYNKEKGTTPAQDGGHRKNILNPEFSLIGVGGVYRKGTYYQAEIFDND